MAVLTPILDLVIPMALAQLAVDVQVGPLQESVKTPILNGCPLPSQQWRYSRTLVLQRTVFLMMMLQVLLLVEGQVLPTCHSIPSLSVLQDLQEPLDPLAVRITLTLNL
jgi:hypothetical protein